MKEKILQLHLTKKWYEMIENGKKKDEYRVFNEYYIKRLTTDIKYRYDAKLHTLQVYQCEFKKFNKVKFHYGYTKKNMSFEIEKIHIAFGKIKWGAPTEKCFIIKLGKKI